MGAALGLGADLENFAHRGFFLVINSRSGRFLPMVYPVAIEQEIDFVPELAGRFKVLGYQAIHGLEDAHKSDNWDPHFAVFW